MTGKPLFYVLKFAVEQAICYLGTDISYGKSQDMKDKGQRFEYITYKRKD